jgi:hypothetical protein
LTRRELRAAEWESLGARSSEAELNRFGEKGWGLTAVRIDAHVLEIALDGGALDATLTERS